VRSPTEALVLLRNAGPEQPRLVIGTSTRDAGRSWGPLVRLPLLNPDAALSGVVLPDGRILVALNDVEVERDALSLVVSSDGGVTWRTARQLEGQVAARRLPVDDARYDRTVEALARATDARVRDARAWVDSSRRFMCWEPRCHFEFSYPFVVETRRGELHLVYTWNRAFIKHVRFNLAWLDQDLPDARPTDLTGLAGPAAASPVLLGLPGSRAVRHPRCSRPSSRPSSPSARCRPRGTCAGSWAT
jgi:hypothetical protein